MLAIHLNGWNLAKMAISESLKSLVDHRPNDPSFFLRVLSAYVLLECQCVMFVQERDQTEFWGEGEGIDSVGFNFAPHCGDAWESFFSLDKSQAE